MKIFILTPFSLFEDARLSPSDIEIDHVANNHVAINVI